MELRKFFSEIKPQTGYVVNVQGVNANPLITVARTVMDEENKPIAGVL